MKILSLCLVFCFCKVLECTRADKDVDFKLTFRSYRRALQRNGQKIKSLSNKLQALEETSELLQMLSSSNPKSKINRLRLQTGFLGFSAWKNNLQVVVTGSVVTFENILVNFGDYYNIDTSMFTCPVEGIYYAAIHLQRYESAALQVEVVLEGNRMFAIDDVNADHPYNTASNTGMIPCLQGNRIWVRAFGQGQVNGSEQRSLFTVMLLREITFSKLNAKMSGAPNDLLF